MVRIALFITFLFLSFGALRASADDAVVIPASEPQAAEAAPSRVQAPAAVEHAAVQAAAAVQAPTPVQAPAAVQAAPAVQTPAAVQAPAPAAAGTMEAEWKYLKKYGEDNDEDVAAAVLPDLENWLLIYPDSPFAAEAQLLKARIHLKTGAYRPALVDLLKQLQEYPDSASGPSARKLFTETAVRKLDGKTAKFFSDLARTSEGASDKAARLADVFGRLAARAGEDFYEPLVTEFRGFFLRFPGYPGRDLLQLQLGDLHLAKSEYLAAELAYEKVIRVYPESAYLAKAKKALGGVLADHLKRYDEAIAVYQDVASSYPGTEEAWTAYMQLAKLTERQKKYSLAVDVNEKIIALYPEKEAAYDSYKAESRILRDELSKYAEAVAVQGRMADKYKGEKGVEALYLAAKIAKKDMKDLPTEIKMYDRIAAEYAQDPQAPKALFAAAEAYEDAKDFDKAKEYYGKVSDLYPKDSLAAKAQKRVNAIISK